MQVESSLYWPRWNRRVRVVVTFSDDGVAFDPDIAAGHNDEWLLSADTGDWSGPYNGLFQLFTNDGMHAPHGISGDFLRVWRWWRHETPEPERVRMAVELLLLWIDATNAANPEAVLNEMTRG